MNYIRVKWIHSFPDEPILLYSEIDDDRKELRKVEIFENGQRGHASLSGNSGSTRLSDEPLPPFAEISSDPQFEPVIITKAEFEGVWAA